MERLTRNNPLTESEAMNLSLTDLYMRLKAYEDAEEQGRLIVLPCKVGDTIYRVSREIDEVWDWEIVEIRILSGDYCEPISFVDDSGNEFFTSGIGKTVFLSHEEAEKALEGMK